MCKLCIMKTIKHWWEKLNKTQINVYGLEKNNNVKWPILFNFIYRFNTILIKIPVGFFIEINKVILKYKETNIQNNFEKIHTILYQDILQSYEIQDSVIFTKGYTHVNGSFKVIIQGGY